MENTSVQCPPNCAVARIIDATLRVVALLSVALLLSSCAGGGAATPDIVKIMAALSTGALASRKTKAGIAFYHYIERRIIYLIGKNSGWATESGFTSLGTRLGSEMDSVAAFAAERLAALGGTDAAVPAHRDLDDAAKQLVTDGPSTISSRAAKYRSDRNERIAQIAWRACAVEPALWSGGDSTLAPALQKPGLLEVLDRRLHAVEIMILHDEAQLGTWSVANAGAGWKDQQRTSMFQYPWVDEFDNAGAPVFAPALAGAGLTIAGLAPTWNEEPTDHRIYYKDQNRVRPAATADWTITSNPYRMTFSGAGPVSAAMERMIPTAPKTDAAFEDFWERNWIYCDMMIATLHVQGFRFARRRRSGTDADFDAAAAAGVTLQPLVPKTGKPDPARLMASGAAWFEGVSISHEELQVGDHLVLWNSPFVRFVLGSAFGLENSFVTRIAADGRAVMMAGHGEPEMTESAFAEELSSEIKHAYEGVRNGVNTVFAANNATVRMRWRLKGIVYQIVLWAPFGEQFTSAAGSTLTANGAWWFRLRLSQMHDTDQPQPTMAEALAAIPKSVRVDPNVHTKPPLDPGDHDADYQESVYLPLSVPKGVRGGWAAYLASPRAGAAVELTDLIPDGSMVPGFYANGPASTIPVFRPKVQP
jgi:hypothetical protein